MEPLAPSHKGILGTMKSNLTMKHFKISVNNCQLRITTSHRHILKLMDRYLEDIDEVLGFEELDHDFTHYKDRMLSIEIVQSHIGRVREGRCLNTIAFPADMRCLTVIMMFNLYSVKKMTTINNARAIFLMELRENTYIDISALIFCIIADETRTTSRAKLIFLSLLIRLF